MGSLRSLHTQGHAETVQEDIDNAFDSLSPTQKAVSTVEKLGN
jgi:hypothetical protein